ncbi:MAG: undecaprenyl/decaprenyl-phosphate alpha-N-acetylglucosaminyl 1-phosphate transferase [Clostridia bacterium]|nr:undecaprenyl/decaprenyl-phosphate alpha-N-acetylglucosaminyl 1-phosphate transferase [Clostridia bacterium]
MAVSVHDLIYALLAILLSGLMAFLLTPLVRVLAFRLKAIDIPKDDRRMHKKPTPRLGGLAIFLAFTVTVILFCNIDVKIIGMLCGGVLIALIGALDDIYRLSPVVKLIGQIVASFVPVLCGITIDHINLFGRYYHFGIFAIPITVIWIVALTNAINLVDGLDGLACGISTISAVSIMVFAILEVDLSIATIVAILVGACLGFLPYNRHPASIFMGDTGALFLGYTLSVISILGVFKVNAFVSFVTPFLIFGLPLLDTATAMLRRVLHGVSPFHADRGHFHHKLIDLGFNQKQAVTILYSISAIFGISAVLFTAERFIAAILIIVITFVIGYLNYRNLVGGKQIREQMGLRLKTVELDDAKNDDKQVKNEGEEK